MAVILSVSTAHSHGDALESSNDDSYSLSEYLPDITESEFVDAPVAVEGSVSLVDGEAAEGAVVTLNVWPSAAELKDLEVGDMIPVSTVAKTMVDEDGDFELKIDQSRELLEYENNGQVDLEVVVHTTDGDVVESFTADVDETLFEDEEAEATESIDFVIEEPQDVSEVVAKSKELETKACGFRKVQDIKKRNVTVAQVYSTTAKVKTDFTYGKGKKSSLGIAANVGNSTVNFKSSGTTSVENSAVNGYNTRTGVHATAYRKQVDYIKTQKVCGGWTAAPPTYHNEFRVRPVDIYGATSASLSATPSANHCSKQESFLIINDKTAITYSNGVSLKSAIGIDLSAQSGYSKSLEIKLTRVSGKKFRSCGTVAVPDGNKSNIGHVVAKA